MKEARDTSRSARALRIAVLLSVALAHPLSADAGRDAAAATIACADLAQATFDGTRITSAELNPESAAAPEHCEIRGRIDERTGIDGKPYAIGFHLRLPAAWNERFFFQGGSGLDGNVGGARGPVAFSGPFPLALAQGYAVVSTDGGHEAESAPGVGGALFGIDPQARLDFGYRALDLTTRVAKQIVGRHYGRAPRYSYFVGCSNGGRQGMVGAERFPEHFDGIVAGDPGFNLPAAAVAQAWDAQAFATVATETDVDGQPYLPSAFSDDELRLVEDGVLASCDHLDGLVDGIIDDPTSCRFSPVDLACRAGNPEPCLPAAKVAALRKSFRGAHNSRGRRLYASFPYDAGIGGPDWRVWKLGRVAQAGSPRVNDALNLTLGATALPYVFVTPPDAIAANQLAQYMFELDFDRDAPRIFRSQGIYRQSSDRFMTARSADLRAFERRGGRLLVYHGVSDPVFSANDTLAWYERLTRHSGGGLRRLARAAGATNAVGTASSGRSHVQSFARLFLVPGMGHCFGGPATGEANFFAALVHWVERGIAPERIVGTAGATTPWPGRTRPLCPYPRQARYVGRGDIEDAASFACR